MNTMEEVDKCLAKAASARQQIYAAASLQCETLHWNVAICEKERIWMAVYQFEDKNQSAILLRTKDAKEQEETFFHIYLDDYKLAPGEYAFSKERYSRIEFDTHGDDVAKTIYSGTEILDGKVVITERDEKTMKGQITCTIPDLSLKGAQEATHKNVKMDISFYFKKGFKFKF
jgi:hypothetical protein